MADDYGLDAALDAAIAEAVIPTIKTAVMKTVEFLSVESPVYTGSYQGHHAVALNSSDLPLVASPEEIRAESSRVAAGGTPGRWAKPTGELVQQAEDALAGFKLGDEIVIGNPVPHAAIIEDVGTKTAPEGNFYRRAASVLRTALDEAS